MTVVTSLAFLFKWGVKWKQECAQELTGGAQKGGLTFPREERGRGGGRGVGHGAGTVSEGPSYVPWTWPMPGEQQAITYVLSE